MTTIERIEELEAELFELRSKDNPTRLEQLEIEDLEIELAQLMTAPIRSYLNAP